MSYNYKDLGLSNTREMFRKANEEGYAVPAFNFNNMEQVMAIVEACAEMGSPVILQCSKGAMEYMGSYMVPMLAKAAVDYARLAGSDIPVALHLDHGPSFEVAKKCIDAGFSSVMIDGSHFPFDENVAEAKKVVDYAHQFDVTVEAELGVLAGIEDDVKADDHIYTNPDEVEAFVKGSGVDSLAIAIGTSHGAHKFKPGEIEDDVKADDHIYTNPDEVEAFVKGSGVDSLAIAIGTSHGAHKFKPGDDPKLRLDILAEIERRIPGFPIVLHGSSAVPGQYVEMIKEYGGTIKDAIGIPDSELRKATQSAVAKINVDTDGRLAFTAGLRKALFTKPGEFDLRKYLGPAKEEMKAYYKTKIVDVFGSEGRYTKATKVVK